MSYGARLGITAGRALKTILGGEEQPGEDEIRTPAQVRARITAMPLFEGPPPWEGLSEVEALEVTGAASEAYGQAADCLAHGFLVLIEEDPTLLEERYVPATYPDGEPMQPEMIGTKLSLDHVMWTALKERWPHVDEWIGGASGFQVGFALNAALYAAEVDVYAPNPAIL